MEDPGARPTVDEAITRLNVVRPADRRPVESRDVISPASFRNSVGGLFGPAQIRELEALIATRATVSALSDT